MSIIIKYQLQCRQQAIKGMLLFILLSNTGCNKLVHIPPPANSITTSQVFADSSDMAAAISGLYSQMEYYGGGGINFCNGSQTVYCGLSSDELVPFFTYEPQIDIYHNNILSNNGTIYNDFWFEPYTFIYQTNACIEAVGATNSVSDRIKNQFLGEAKFLRALDYFYMVNLFGDVPAVTSTGYANTSLLKRTPQPLVYQQIIDDLKDAKRLLPSDYSFSNGQRTRANQGAATALLARVYLYSKSYDSAATEANLLINNHSLYNLDTLNGVFNANSSEAILQWQLNTSLGNFNSTSEGLFIPDDGGVPFYYLSTELLNAFEVGDNRRNAWVDSVSFNDQPYFVPYKYKVGSTHSFPNAAASEYYTVLRLAEQYLIRAEAELNGGAGGVDAAIGDLNVIRNRAGLPNYAGTPDKPSVLAEILHQRQIEFFAEWGHRWLDLKRTGQVDSVMSVTPKKGGGSWNSYQQWYPIPQFQLNLDPNLTQNPGY